MHHWYTELRKKKSATVGDFLKDVIKPSFAGTGATAAQMREVAVQIFHHMKSDGLIEHTAGKED